MERDKWRHRGEREIQRGFLYGFGELGPWWSRAEAIGLGGRFSGAASCAESRDVSGCVGGVRVRSENGRAQKGRGRFGSWLGCHSASRGWAE
jgi:hypothetical protein